MRFITARIVVLVVLVAVCMVCCSALLWSRREAAFAQDPSAQQNPEAQGQTAQGQAALAVFGSLLGGWSAVEAEAERIEVRARVWWWDGEGNSSAEGVVLSVLDGGLRIEADEIALRGLGWAEGTARGVKVVWDVGVVCGRWPGSGLCEVLGAHAPALEMGEVSWDGAGVFTAQNLMLEVRVGGMRGAGGHRLGVQALTWTRATGEVEAQGVGVALCRCGAEASSDTVQTSEGLAPSLHIGTWRARLAAAPTKTGGKGVVIERMDGEGASLGVLGVRWPLMFGEVSGEDGRATGFLWPRLGYSGSLGWYGALPLFVRLGPSADVTVEAGFASSLGATLDTSWRWALNPLSVGDLGLGAAWGEDGPRLWSQGQGRFQLGRVFAVGLEGDFVSDLALNRARATTLWARTKPYGRSRVGVGAESDTFYLWALADLLQPLPRTTSEAVAAFDPFPSDLATYHRLPWVSFGWFTKLKPWLRWDLDSDYAQAVTFGEVAAQEPSLAGAPTTAHQALVRAALSGVWSVWGYGQVEVAANLTQRLVVAERADEQAAFHRNSVFGLSAGLRTHLSRRFDFATHLIEPSVVWRWVPKQSSDDRLGAPHPWSRQQEMTALAQTLEAKVSSRWLGNSGWRLSTQLGGLMVWDDALQSRAGCGALCVLLTSRLAVQFPALGISFEGATRYALEDWDKLTGRASFMWRSPSGLLLGLSHASTSDMALWFDAEPLDVIPGAPWRQITAPDASTTGMFSAARLGWRAQQWGIEGAAAQAWDVDPDIELALGADLTAACGCWRIGIAGARHMTAPRWDAWLSLSLSLDASASPSATLPKPVLPHPWP